jgi:hypothetical protein
MELTSVLAFHGQHAFASGTVVALSRPEQTAIRRKRAQIAAAYPKNAQVIQKMLKGSVV